DLGNLRTGRGARVEDIAEPFSGQPASEMEADDTLAESEDLAVVRQDGPLHAEGVVRDGGTDARHLVGRDGYSDSRAADQDRPVRFPSRDLLSCSNRHRRVGGPIEIFLENSKINNFDSVVGLHISQDPILVVESRTIASNQQSNGSGHTFCPSWFLDAAAPGAAASWSTSTSAIAVTIRPSDIAPGSGVPTLRSASGRARPIFGTSDAVASAALLPASAAERHASEIETPASPCPTSVSTNGNKASSMVLSPTSALLNPCRSRAET